MSKFDHLRRRAFATLIAGTVAAFVTIYPAALHAGWGNRELHGFHPWGSAQAALLLTAYFSPFVALALAVPFAAVRSRTDLRPYLAAGGLAGLTYAMVQLCLNWPYRDLWPRPLLGEVVDFCPSLFAGVLGGWVYWVIGVRPRTRGAAPAKSALQRMAGG